MSSSIPKGLVQALENYIKEGVPTSTFLNAVLANDLYEAVNKATPENLAALPAILQWLKENAPEGSYGSEAIYRRWLYEHPVRAKGPFEVV